MGEQILKAGAGNSSAVQLRDHPCRHQTVAAQRKKVVMSGHGARKQRLPEFSDLFFQRRIAPGDRGRFGWGNLRNGRGTQRRK